MSRVKSSETARQKHKKIMKLAKGYRGTRSRRFKNANEAVIHALTYAYRDRRNKKREIRKLWIIRINAGARENGLSYNKFMSGLKKAGIDINRKVLADLAATDSTAFAKLVQTAKESLAS